ncbi:hypothetical protein F4823DRAFT_191869 [Ustulina deusta]|nr:hypothetical protein F4823DRAFT_191869 [Ustulina deusta]
MKPILCRYSNAHFICIIGFSSETAKLAAHHIRVYHAILAGRESTRAASIVGTHMSEGSLVVRAKQRLQTDCCNCSDDQFDLCHACYKTGIRCNAHTEHTLQLHLAGNPKFLTGPPPSCNRTTSTFSLMATGSCNRCHGDFAQGCYYWRKLRGHYLSCRVA